MLKATLGFKKIVEDVDNFSLKGMIEPTFYNFGDQNVHVLYSIVKPGESFLAGVSNMVMDNDVVIRFEGNNKIGRNLMVYYGSPVQNC
jgi:hypothetical protein